MAELNITNNVPHTTVQSTKVSKYKATITLTADEGYKITSAQVTFVGGYGYPTNEAMIISADGKTALWENDDCETGQPFTISGETENEGAIELNVINDITGSNFTVQHTYEDETATFNVTGSSLPYKVRFYNLNASYTNKAGSSSEQPFTVTDLETGQEATLTITDIDPTKTITLTGSYDKVVEVVTNLTLCTANDLPTYLRDTETLSVTLTASEGTEFDTEQSTPQFFYLTNGLPEMQNFSVSNDNKTATGQIAVNVSWEKITVNGVAYPVEVVGQQNGAINVYLVTLDELSEFSAKRFFKETGLDETTFENIDLGTYVNRIRRIYADIPVSSDDTIRCGNYNTGVTCKQPSADKITLEFGTARVPAHNNDITDFESEVQIFLPFAGFVNLNKDFVGKIISLQYVINVLTGNGVAILKHNNIVFQVEEVKPSTEIIYLSPSVQVKTMGGDYWNEMLFWGLEPYIYCKWYESASDGRNNDRKTAVLGDLTGFNILDDVSPIHTPTMLTEEQELIYRALADGVYIE